MSYLHLTYYHLATVAPAVLIGAGLLAARKGTKRHRAFGKIYMVLVFITALVTLRMQAEIGPRLFNHFGFIHGFSFLALWSIPHALIAVRRGNITAHKRAMVGLYVGGMLIAGTLALAPGRLLHQWLLG